MRWAIQTAWSAFENFCSDALAADGLGTRFKDRFNAAVAAKHVQAVDWGQGIWQQVLRVYELRKGFIHVVPSISHEKLKTPLEDAENAIVVLRDGIKAAAALVGLPTPLWVDDDEDRGWQGTHNGFSSTADGYVVRAGVDENDSANVLIVYVLRDEEHMVEIALPGTPHGPLLERLLGSLNVPVEAVRAYRGPTLIEERKMRIAFEFADGNTIYANTGMREASSFNRLITKCNQSKVLVGTHMYVA